MAGQLTLDTLKASSGVLATQNGMTGIAKAWVNFDGQTAPNNTIRQSFNVSSVTYVTTGQWAINFTASPSNANACCVATTGYNYLAVSATDIASAGMLSASQAWMKNATSGERNAAVCQFVLFSS